MPFFAVGYGCLIAGLIYMCGCGVRHYWRKERPFAVLLCIAACGIASMGAGVVQMLLSLQK